MEVNENNEMEEIRRMEEAEKLGERKIGEKRDKEEKNKAEEELFKERKEKLKDFLFNKKSILVLIGLIVLIILAWHIRTANVNNLKDITTGEYTLGPDLDPFLFVRYAKYIVENGKLMENDSMRYVPLGYNTAGGTGMVVLPYMIAYFHLFLSKFSDVSINYSAVIFPAFMFLLTVIAFFLFIRKVFENKKNKNIIALIAAAFLIVSSSLLPRTVAGIPEKESAGFLFMFLAFYFFLLAWKSEKIKKSLIAALLAGLSTEIMSLIWGGVIYIFVIIALFVFIEFVFGKISKEKLFAYAMWIFASFFLMIFFSAKTLKILIISTSSGMAFMIFSLLLIDFLIFQTKIKNWNLIGKLRRKFPDRVISIFFFIILGLIFLNLFLGLSFIPKFITDIILTLTRPYANRLSFTVAENRQPYFGEWKNSFGPIVKGIPLFFWLFFIGSIFLFYESIKKIGRKGKFLLTIIYIIFLFALIFSRYSSGSIMNGTNWTSKIIYFGSFLLLASSSIYLFYTYFKQGKLGEFKKINSSYLFLLSFFFVSLIGARSAIRLIMVLSVPTAGIAGFFSVVVVEKMRKERDSTLKIVFGVLAIIVVISTLYSFYFNYQETIMTAKGMIPSVYTQQWQKAMAWVRDNTPENAVFAHWWDYGYWVQSIGNRATVLDGGNSVPYWNHLIGRHVLTGQSEQEALEFLYAHKASYLLIDSTEIGKYGAYSSIGSDEEYDRYSQIATFREDEKNIQETKNEIIHLYTGSMWLDQDYLWQEGDKKEFLPAYKAGIGGVILKESKKGEIKQPTAIFVYQGRQISIPMRYVYYQGNLYDFENGYGSCLYILPELVSSGGGNFIKNTGRALFISEKSMKALWVKLYLFNDGKSFELVHKEQSFVINSLKTQNADVGDVGDFIFYSDVQGPIKIWKINYPPNVEFKEEYLETYYPEELRIAKSFFT